MSYVEKVEGGSISWGTMIAGAAAVTGAVLLAPALTAETGDTIPQALQTIGNAIAESVTGFFAKPTVPTEPNSFFAGLGQILKDFGEYVSKNAPLLSGAALLGGGVAGLTMSGKNTAYVVKNQPLQVAPSHVENEQMRAISGLMKARMMAASPAYMAQAMGQGPSVG